MTTKQEQLIAILKDMFQFDQADLDFGVYRIMGMKRAEIQTFLDEDLPRQIADSLQALSSSNVASKIAEINKEIDSIKNSTYSATTKAVALQELETNKDALLASQNDISSVEADIYNHLHKFFARYYDNGDFMSLRRYKDGTYVIPYEGEEVKLHWANADQYYTKTGENFKNYTFKLDNKTIHFSLIEAETEKDNNKSKEKRVFQLHENNPFAIDGDTLTIYMEYKAGDKQASHIAEIIKTLEANPALMSFGKLFIKEGGKSLLEKQLNKYTARNTQDYFIHKDLGKFLHRELDFYIKNEVLFLEDMEESDPNKLKEYLVKAKTISKIAKKIITFLAQLEDFQKKLWLKKKFIVASHYCITLDKVGESFYDAIIANDAQREEWVRLFAIDEIKATTPKNTQGSLLDESNATVAYSVPLTKEFLEQNQNLVLDTAFFDEAFEERILESIDDLDAQTDGLMISSENFQALNLLQEKYQEQVKCVYIDPPYNTDGDGFIYKDSYRHSTWLSMIYDRVESSYPFLTIDGTFFASIDEKEQTKFREVLNNILGSENFIADLIWAGGRKNDSKFISVSHEYILTYLKNKEYLSNNKVEWKQRKKGLDDIYKKYAQLKKEFKDDYRKMTQMLKKWYKDLPDSDPAKSHKHYSHIDSKGVYFPADISWPGGGGPRYEVLHPTTNKPVKIPSRGWITSNEEKMQEWIRDNRVHFGEDETFVPCLKSYLKDREEQVPYSIFYKDGRAATKRLRNIINRDDLKFPKDEQILAECVNFTSSDEALVLDYFAGSGTTGHAVINLNREDGGQRKYILVEMGEYFDTVTKPRIQKVVYSDTWKNGKPENRSTGTSHIMKYMRLESYEDTLDNITLSAPSGQLGTLGEEYMLSYMLDFEAQNSPSLLSLESFKHPFDYTMNITQRYEKRAEKINLVESFNYLIGLTVEKNYAKQSYDADFSNGEHGVLSARIRKGTTYAIKMIEGTNRKGENVLVIWRNITDSQENDNAVLDAFFRKRDIRTQDKEYAKIYVNCDNNLPNLRTDIESWKVILIEEEMKKRMVEGA